ncbi:hypothetical protein DL98DRAFT_371537, partial [Cadophora sp. DSE1049]
LMFDNNSLSRSELFFYFTTLQLLRISSEWIRGGMEDLKSLAEASAWYYKGLPDSDGPKRSHDDPTSLNVSRVLEQNWKNKTEEVKSLRDGLFNATAVREASRRSTLNHYILVFTVVTIVYLPLSFTAVS